MFKKIGFSILKIGAYILLFALLSAVAIFGAKAVGGEAFCAQTPIRVGLEIALTAAAVAPAIFLALLIDKWRVGSLGYAWTRLRDLLVGTLLGAAILSVPIALLLATGAARFEPDLAGFSANGLALGLIVCFFNVWTQEAMVRSYIFQELWSKYGAWIATLVTTLLFVSMHANAIMQGTAGLLAGANILLASLLLSLAYVRTGSLWLPIGIHLGWNGLQGPVLGINVTGMDLGFGHWSLFEFPGDALWTGGAMGVEGGLAGLIGPALGIAAVALLVKQQPKPDFTPRTK
jgi:membrane protease YdiL (CAAX protease family)